MSILSEVQSKITGKRSRIQIFKASFTGMSSLGSNQKPYPFLKQSGKLETENFKDEDIAENYRKTQTVGFGMNTQVKG